MGPEQGQNGTRTGPEPDQNWSGRAWVWRQSLCFCVFFLCDQMTNQRAAQQCMAGGGPAADLSLTSRSIGWRPAARCQTLRQRPPLACCRTYSRHPLVGTHLSGPLFSRSFFFSSSHIFFGLFGAPCCSPRLKSVSQSET